MNTHKTIKPKLRLKVDHIGPIMNLDDELSERTQNLIFATNGCGKTFIARTLRLLDSTAPEVEENISNPSNLVSEEGAIGNMQLTKGDTTLAEINLDTDQTVTTVKQGEHLFHVFSSDYLEHELRSKQYNLDGNIVHQTILGKENQELDQKEELLSTTTENRTKLIQQLAENFAEKRSDFQSNFAINGSLKEFRGLEVENCFRYEVPEKLVSLTEITKQYGAFKALPEDPVLPDRLGGTPVFLMARFLVT